MKTLEDEVVEVEEIEMTIKEAIAAKKEEVIEAVRVWLYKPKDDSSRNLSCAMHELTQIETQDDREAKNAKRRERDQARRRKSNPLPELEIEA
jgi:hypothetical protein